MVFIEWLSTGRISDEWGDVGVEGFYERQRIFGSDNRSPLQHEDDIRSDNDIHEAPSAESPLMPNIRNLLITSDGCTGQFHGKHSFLWLQVSFLLMS